MSIFGTKNPSKRHENRLDDLTDDVHTLQRSLRSLELEYVDLYDKVKRQMSRMAKRYAVDNPPPESPSNVETDTDPGNGIDPISAKILARRGTRRQAE